jgi:L-2-hydroxyglutarate oxidase LhgO
MTKDIKDIIIIGTGWFGLHTALLLEQKYNVLILEKNSTIFNNSSNFNQNRLHLGYHYPRSYKTRELCLKGYTKFINKYRELIDFIDNNYYCISNDSLIDYNTYKQIYNTSNYKHSFIKNTLLIITNSKNIAKPV